MGPPSTPYRGNCCCLKAQNQNPNQKQPTCSLSPLGRSLFSGLNVFCPFSVTAFHLSVICFAAANFSGLKHQKRDIVFHCPASWPGSSLAFYDVHVGVAGRTTNLFPECSEWALGNLPVTCMEAVPRDGCSELDSIFIVGMLLWTNHMTRCPHIPSERSHGRIFLSNSSVCISWPLREHYN